MDSHTGVQTFFFPHFNLTPFIYDYRYKYGNSVPFETCRYSYNSIRLLQNSQTLLDNNKLAQNRWYSKNIDILLLTPNPPVEWTSPDKTP